MFDFLEECETWVFDIDFVCCYFRYFNRQNVKIFLSRFVKIGLIERLYKGFYANPRSKCRPIYPLEHIASILRHKETFYLSLETLLSEEGLISQIPNRLTFISQGRSQVLKTTYGIIEFVHTSTHFDLSDENYFFYNQKRGIYEAKPQRAIDDLYRHNRCIDLYEEQLQKDALYD